MVSASVAMKLVTTSVNSLMSLELVDHSGHPEDRPLFGQTTALRYLVTAASHTILCLYTSNKMAAWSDLLNGGREAAL